MDNKEKTPEITSQQVLYAALTSWKPWIGLTASVITILIVVIALSHFGFLTINTPYGRIGPDQERLREETAKRAQDATEIKRAEIAARNEKSRRNRADKIARILIGKWKGNWSSSELLSLQHPENFQCNLKINTTTSVKFLNTSSEKITGTAVINVQASVILVDESGKPAPFRYRDPYWGHCYDLSLQKKQDSVFYVFSSLHDQELQITSEFIQTKCSVDCLIYSLSINILQNAELEYTNAVGNRIRLVREK